MEFYISFLTLLLGLAIPTISKGQVCQEVKLYDDKQQQILAHYIQECLHGRTFVDDKGVVHLSEYKDAQGRLVWELQAFIDDRYRDSPPTHWASLNGDIILIYRVDSTTRALTDVERGIVGLPERGNSGSVIYSSAKRGCMD